MRKFYLMIVAIMFSFVAFSQLTLPYLQNFDTFMAGDHLASQVTNTALWTTWSNAPGTSEDPIVSDAYSVSAPNAVKISTGNDCVFKTGGIVDGRYKVSFDMYIPNGQYGYFNMLQEFNGSNSKWAYQIFFSQGTAKVQGGPEESTFAYNFDTWMHMVTKIDLDADWCEIYVDDVKVHEFQWSVGTSNTDTKVFDAINFYGWSENGGTPEYYFDNLAIDELEPLYAPVNVLATVENTNDVSLTWEAPAEATPTNYNVYRNNVLIAEGVAELRYTDINVYPRPYVYGVKAFYEGEGVSGSATAEVTVEGGVARKTVLFEDATGTWCEFCPSVARGIDQMYEEGKMISAIAYHREDAYENDAAMARITYYGVTGYPTVEIDGTTEIVGGSHEGNDYDKFLTIYNNLMEVPSVIDLDMTVTYLEGRDYQIDITASEVYQYFDSGVKLRVALVESHIDEAWQGLSEVNFAMRAMIADGSVVDFSDASTQDFSMTYTVADDIDVSNCHVVAFLQHDDSKFVVQSMNVALPEIPVTEVSLTFNYDVTCITGEGNEWFMFDTDTLFVTGTFAGWSEPGTEGSVMLSDNDGDKIYSATVVVDTNQTIEYKYFSGPGWNGGEWDGDPNRQVTVAFEDLTVNDVDTSNCGGTGVLAESFTGVNLYPNPASDMIYLNGLSEVTKVVMSNVVGQIVATRQLAGEYEIAIPMEDKQSGIYFVTFVDKDNNKYTQKIIKE